MSIYHASLVHFPIALFLSCCILGLIGVFFRRGLFKEFLFWNLMIGLIFTLGSIYTGLKEEITPIKTQSMTELLNIHKRNAFILAGFFTSLTVWMGLRKKEMKNMEYVVWVLFLWIGGFSTYFEAHTGHKMVYEEGAGIEAVEDQLNDVDRNSDSETIEEEWSEE
ncbi:MAG TPA: DUF2231 domain-containing protein [Cytophagaceae bacterium]|jgi:uncharacterized membrane protein